MPPEQDIASQAHGDLPESASRAGIPHVAIHVPHDAIADFCRGYQVARLALFGSVLRHSFREDSDVDVLVEFQPGARVGYLTMARMARELTGILGRRVDLRTLAELHRSFLDAVLSEAMTEYVAA